jgi:hypothetical protein
MAINQVILDRNGWVISKPFMFGDCILHIQTNIKGLKNQNQQTYIMSEVGTFFLERLTGARVEVSLSRLHYNGLDYQIEELTPDGGYTKIIPPSRTNLLWTVHR